MSVRPHLQRIATGSVGWIVLLAGWALLTETGLVDPLFLSSPSQTLMALLGGFASGDLREGLEATLFRSLSGFGIAVLLGTPLGLVLGGFAKADRILGNVIDGLRSMPATALFPAFMLVFGIGDEAKSQLSRSCASGAW